MKYLLVGIWQKVAIMIMIWWTDQGFF